MSGLIVELVKGLAEGAFGRLPARAYWWLSGKKTWTGAVLAGAYGALSYIPAESCASCEVWAGRVLLASGVLLGIGLVDKGIRAQAPVKPSGL